MPALENAEGVMRIIIRHTLAGQNVYNVLHLARTDLGDTDDFPLGEVSGAAEDVHTSWATNIMALSTAHLVLQEVTAVDLTSDTAASVTFADPYPGIAAGTPYPSNVAACISWHANVRYRGGHPRTYLAGVPDTNSADSRHFDPDWLGPATTAANAFLNDAPTGTQYILLRRTVDGAALPVPARYSLVSGSINARMDSQRRRLGRV